MKPFGWSIRPWKKSKLWHCHPSFVEVSPVLHHIGSNGSVPNWSNFSKGIPQKINGWNLRIRPPWKKKWKIIGFPKHHGLRFQLLIFEGVFAKYVELSWIQFVELIRSFLVNDFKETPSKIITTDDTLRVSTKKSIKSYHSSFLIMNTHFSKQATSPEN